MNRWWACSLAGTIACAAVALTPAGCSGSASDQSDGGAEASHPDRKAPPPVDGGADHSIGKDAAKDAVSPLDSTASEAGGDGGDGGPFGIPAEGGPTVPAGATQLVNTVDAGFDTVGMQVLGITDDDYVIYTGLGKTEPVFAVPLAGGASIPIVADAGTAGYLPLIIHRTVFIWTGQTIDMTFGNSVGVLTFWTKAGGVQATTTHSTVGAVSASPDGTKVVYSANVSTRGTTGDFVASNADGTGKTTLLTGTSTSLPIAIPATIPYFPDLGFTNDAYFVATHQEVTDAGLSSATVSFWDTATWTKTDLIQGAAVATGPGATLTSGVSWSSSRTGTGFGSTVVASTSAGALQAFDLPSATHVPIDTGVTSFYMKPDGSGVFYGTGSSGAYKLAALPSAAITTILTTGYGGFIYNYPYLIQSQPLGDPPSTISPDGNWAVFYKVPGPTYDSDLNLIQNVASSTSVPLLSAPTGIINNEDAFTADSTYALYMTSYTSVGTGSLYAYPVAGSEAVAISTNNVWDSNYLAGTKILYMDNYMALSNGVADIYTVDVSASTLAPTSIIKAADSSYWLTTDRTKMVFSLIAAGNTKTNGIWVIAP